ESSLLRRLPDEQGRACGPLSGRQMRQRLGDLQECGSPGSVVVGTIVDRVPVHRGSYSDVVVVGTQTDVFACPRRVAPRKDCGDVPRLHLLDPLRESELGGSQIGAWLIR